MLSLTHFLIEKRSFATFSSVFHDPWYKHFKFGFEVECLLPIPQQLETKNADIASELKDFLHETTITSDRTGLHNSSESTKVITSQGQVYFHVEDDASVKLHTGQGDFDQVTADKNDVSRYTNFEIVSRTFDNLNECVNKIRDVFHFIDLKDGITNESTGFHFTISGFPKDVSWYRVLQIMGDQHILKLFDRENNKFALSHTKRIHFAKDKVTNSQSLLDLGNQQIHISDPSERKYSSLNIKSDKMVELRSMGGTHYHHRFNDITFTILNYLSAIKESIVTSMNQKDTKKMAKKVTVSSESRIEKINFFEPLIKFKKIYHDIPMFDWYTLIERFNSGVSFMLTVQKTKTSITNFAWLLNKLESFEKDPQSLNQIRSAQQFLQEYIQREQQLQISPWPMTISTMSQKIVKMMGIMDYNQDFQKRDIKFSFLDDQVFQNVMEYLEVMGRKMTIKQSPTNGYLRKIKHNLFLMMKDRQMNLFKDDIQRWLNALYISTLQKQPHFFTDEEKQLIKREN